MTVDHVIKVTVFSGRPATAPTLSAALKLSDRYRNGSFVYDRRPHHEHITWQTANRKDAGGFNVDPCGKFLLSVGMHSAAMTVHTIDQSNGELKPSHQYPMGTQPNWVEIVDLIKS
jgi:6-phosphogluconolactonase (cycloisomerase 2 family)